LSVQGSAPKSIAGGCLCGAVRFEYGGAVGPANFCHCADCRHVTGSAFNVGVRFESAHFKIVLGAAKSFTKRGDSGAELTRHFCPECGSPLFTNSQRHPEYIYVKAGAFDDPLIVRPEFQCWTRSRVAWAFIPNDLPDYEKGRT
jgi:hypothetical protein